MKQKRYAKGYVREVSGETEGLLSGVVGSTAAVDRYGEVIDQSTWDLKHFKKNPVILWAHNLTLGEDRPPIGKAVKVKVDGDSLVFDIQFDMADPFAADIFRKYKEKFLNAFSVGFIPHKIQRSDDSKEAPILMDNELLELSAVPVPANPEALQQLKARSFRARSWDAMLKEADDENAQDAKEEEEQEEEVETPEETIETEQPNDEEKNVDVIAEKVAQKLLPQIKSSISEVVKNGGSAPSEDVSGGKQHSEKDKLGVEGVPSKKTVAVMRQATKLLQSALAEVNASSKASR